MVKLTINLPVELSEQISIDKIKKRLHNKEDVVLDIIKNYYKGKK